MKIFEDQSVWSNFSKKAVLGPNLISTYLPEVIEQSSLAGLKRLVFLGRFHPQKRPEWVVRLSADSLIPALMIGDGKLKQEVCELADSLDVQVEFTGFLTNPWKILRKGDVLVLTSRFEGKPLVIEEALIRGFPVLSINLYGILQEYRDCPVYFANDYADLLKIVCNFNDIIKKSKYRRDFPNLIKERNTMKIQLWKEILDQVAQRK